MTKVRTPTVDDQLDEVIDSLTGLDEHHHSPWLLEFGDKLLDAVGTDDGLALGLVFQKAIDLGNGSVESYDSEAVVSHIEDEVLAHDGQTDEAKVSSTSSSALISKRGVEQAPGKEELCTMAYPSSVKLVLVHFHEPHGKRIHRSSGEVLRGSLLRFGHDDKF